VQSCAYMKTVNKKFLINKKPLSNAVVKASFFILAFSILFYIYTNISTVFALINYKKSNLSLDKKSEQLVKLENDISNFKYNLTIKDANDFDLVKINSSKFIVRKDTLTMFSINYEIFRH
jgi:hypothetical protein